MTAWVCRQMETTDPKCKNHKSHHKNQWNISSVSYYLKTLWCSCPLSWGTKKLSHNLTVPSDIGLIRMKGSGPRTQRYTTVILILECITKLKKKSKVLLLLSMTIQSIFLLEAEDIKFKDPSFFMPLRRERFNMWQSVLQYMQTNTNNHQSKRLPFNTTYVLQTARKALWTFRLWSIGKILDAWR